MALQGAEASPRGTRAGDDAVCIALEAHIDREVTLHGWWHSSEVLGGLATACHRRRRRRQAGMLCLSRAVALAAARMLRRIRGCCNADIHVCARCAAAADVRCAIVAITLLLPV